MALQIRRAHRFLSSPQDQIALRTSNRENWEKVPDTFSIFLFLPFCIFLGVFPELAFAAEIIPLPSGPAQPSLATTEEFIQALTQSSRSSMHGMASFSELPSLEKRKWLQTKGLRVLSFFSGRTYRVIVSETIDIADLASSNQPIFLYQLKPQDRVNPHIWNGEFNRYVVTPPRLKPLNYVLNPDNTLNLTVRFHIDVSEQSARSILKVHTRGFRKQSDLTWVAIVAIANLPNLATENLIQWIDVGPLPFIPENNKTRRAIHVDATSSTAGIQSVSAMGEIEGLKGAGVQIAIFDGGIDQGHDDFSIIPGILAFHRILNSSNAKSNHGTLVAGIVGGNGARSFNYPDPSSSSSPPPVGTKYQWRGMAPDAHLIEALTTSVKTAEGDDSGIFIDGGVAAHRLHITGHGMDLSNHSYAVSFEGNYDAQNQLRDEIIRGDATDGGNPVPGRLHVYSAGNQGQYLEGRRAEGTGLIGGYYSITKELKNGLVVGNWNIGNLTNANQLDPSSSLGPAFDGRIKPDVVAPGELVVTTCYDDPACPRRPPTSLDEHGYNIISGTSLAAAAVTGSLALVLQAYSQTYGVNLDVTPPLPSTLRGIMIHTAGDKFGNWFCNGDGVAVDQSCSVVAGSTFRTRVQATHGPDFATGWGMINAKTAVDLVTTHKLLREDMLTDTCQIKIYTFEVPNRVTHVRMTLAWDDYSADSAIPATAPTLVNDLDIIITDPKGQIHYPWRLNHDIVNTLNADPHDQEPCGTEITINRPIMPGSWQGAPDPIPQAGFPPVSRHRDHLNNVEVVDIEGSSMSPVITVPSGTWTTQVIGFKIPQGPQSFSLVGPTFTFQPSVGLDTTPPIPPTGLEVK